MEENNTLFFAGFPIPNGADLLESVSAAAAAAPSPPPSRKRKENPAGAEAYKSVAKACLEKEDATSEKESLQKHIAVLQKKLKETQRREEAAEAKVKTSMEELRDQHGVDWNHHDSVWVENYREIIEYQKQNPDSAGPGTKTPLGKWVSRQRTLHTTKERMKEDERFDWGTARDPRVPWEERYQELLHFKDRIGHCNPALNTEYHNLAVFVKAQRQIYQEVKKGKSSRILTEERIRLLEEAGFEWRRHAYKNRKKKSKEENTEATV